jgi:plastocyanin
MSRIRAGSLAVLLLTLAAAPAAAADRTVRVGDNWFARASGAPAVTVARGDTVTWRFIGREPHNVHADRGPVTFTSPIRQDGVYRRTLTRRGTYRIVCDIHGSRDQRMTLIVR